MNKFEKHIHLFEYAQSVFILIVWAGVLYFSFSYVKFEMNPINYGETARFFQVFLFFIGGIGVWLRHKIRQEEREVNKVIKDE